MLRVELQDITSVVADAIVNPSDRRLSADGGLDAAIHNKAGPELRRECSQLFGLEIGEAKLTRGYLLPTPFIIHTASPVWKGGHESEREQLMRCYENIFALAHQYRLTRIAIPCIGTGHHRVPTEIGCTVAMGCARAALQNRLVEEIIFCCHVELDYHAYLRQLGLSAA